MTASHLNTQFAEVLPEPVFIFSTKDLILGWMNPAAESWLKCSFASKLGLKISKIVSGFEELELIARATAASGATTRGHELKIQVLGTDVINASYLIFPFDGNVAIMLSAQRSNDARVADGYEEQTVSMIGHMLAHELKNPLAGIYGAVQLLEADISDAANLEITELIKSEVKRIGRLVDKIETFGAVEATGYGNFNVHTVLRKALLLFQNADNIEIEFVENYDPSLPDVYGNSDQIMQIIVNFLANAIDAVNAQPGRKSLIEIHTVYRAGVRKQAPKGDFHTLPIEVKIIDNGVGVAQHLKERMFQPFVTGKANGHGLGLALVSKIIEEHGGIVSCNNEIDKTIFSVLLPNKR